MRLTILDAYIYRLFLPLFASILLTFNFVVTVVYLKEILRMAIEKAIPVYLLLQLLGYTMVANFGTTIPMAAILATILTVSRLNGQSEFTALRAAGVAHLRVMRPFFFVSAILAVMLWFLCHQTIPYAREEISLTHDKIIEYFPLELISNTHEFYVIPMENGQKGIVYFEGYEHDKAAKRIKLKKVQLRQAIESDGTRIRRIVLADTAIKMQPQQNSPGSETTLRLFHGEILESIDSSDPARVTRIDFSNGTLDLKFAAPKGKSIYFHERHAMSDTELKVEIDQRQFENSPEGIRVRKRFESDFHRRNVLPASPLITVFLAFSFALMIRTTRAQALAAGTILILAYYFTHLFMNELSISLLWLPVSLALWLPNILCFGAATALLWRNHRTVT